MLLDLGFGCSTHPDVAHRFPTFCGQAVDKPQGRGDKGAPTRDNRYLGSSQRPDVLWECCGWDQARPLPSRGGRTWSPEASGQGTSRHHPAAKHSACAWIAPGKPVDGVMLTKALGSSGFIAYRKPEWAAPRMDGV
jgi:hypothetical protein